MAVSVPATPLLAVEGLRLAATASGTPVPLLDGVSLTVGRGESVAIVGESGSGKSLTMRAAMGLLPDGVEVTGGTVRLDGTDLLTLPPRERAALRGHRMSLLLQDPFTMLHPQLSCGRQIADGLLPGFAAPGGGRARRAAVRAEVVRRLAEVGLDAAVADRHPHELSGGMRQRVATAAALAGDPDLLIADEPTTALDAANRRAVLDLLGELRARRGMGLVLVTHDLRAAFSAGDRVHVLYAGQILEQGPATRLHTVPGHPYTAALLAAEPSLTERYAELPALPGSVPPPGSRGSGCPFADRCPHTAGLCRTTPLLATPVPGAPQDPPHLTACLRAAELGPGLAPVRRTVVERGGEEEGDPEPAPEQAALHLRGLHRVFRSPAGDHTALHEVDLTVRRGQIVALAGESGSGKTTLARIAAGLESADRGTCVVGGVPLTAGRRPTTAERRRLASRVQIVFQDPYSSLNPLRDVGATLREALTATRGRLPRAEADAEVARLLDQVRLPASYARRRPAALSGGERQRVAVARALAARPELLICDEAVAALDVSVQAQLLSLLGQLRDSEGFAVLFITHDLAVVRQLADRAVVMHRGRVVEQGPAARVLDRPEHPWTRRMLDGHLTP
ncbi:ABC transporter ATP-binding protein [Streptomyces albidoflavus]|uniref:ABC transporter ATP-binding protein n=1 Tax=Streptomyces albidoflavus TaxID=1886 RepID=A0AA37FAL8_9ACTN|nr:ABC transporter ATP-binding protein [Streptomyces albidoflavus]RZE61857.1 glutathione ABC transporter ATP-binding protein [Streptomyces albidoflavus]WQG70668.1 ABC transporter ATP-binding protein [Streptomyces albidoflavus]GHI44990.1 ABC transporter ATP-binding protein [Streptomyces albidoflavus]